MFLAWLLLLTGLTISAVAIYYSVVGLTAIFSAAVIPIIVMGTTLEVAKLVCASWLKANWERAPRFMKTYMTAAVVVLMIITSMGIFGFLSKAHNDQNLVSGDVQSRIAIYDEKIKTAKENIEANRKQLKQMDEAVDQIMARSTSEGGADKANAVRKSQQRDRAALAKDIEANQKLVAKLNDEAAPIRAEIRKVEAEVGPIKYIAKFIYGEDGANENMLEKAVTWVIILIVIVFDPLAVIMLLGAQMTFGWMREQKEQEAKEGQDIDFGPDPYVADVGEKPTQEEIAEIATEEAEVAKQFVDHGEHPQDTFEHEVDPVVEPVVEYTVVEDADDEHVEEVQEPVEEVQESELDKWNKMIAEAEQELAKEQETATVEEEILAPEDESKKKTYMTKDEQGQTQIKTRL